MGQTHKEKNKNKKKQKQNSRKKTSEKSFPHITILYSLKQKNKRPKADKDAAVSFCSIASFDISFVSKDLIMRQDSKEASQKGRNKIPKKPRKPTKKVRILHRPGAG